MKLPRRTCQGAAKKEPHRPRSCPGGTVKDIQGVAQEDLPRSPPGAGSCRCPSATGAPLCSARTQVRTCHCHMEGRPCPSNLSPWSSWCTCNGWKAWMLTEGGVRDPNFRCYAGGRPRPDSTIPRVTWCTCEPQEAKTRETKETLEREAPGTGELTGSSKGAPETWETKEAVNIVKNKTSWRRPPNRRTSPGWKKPGN